MFDPQRLIRAARAQLNSTSGATTPAMSDLAQEEADNLLARDAARQRGRIAAADADDDAHIGRVRRQSRQVWSALAENNLFGE